MAIPFLSHLEWNDVDLNGGEEAERSVGPRDGVKQIRVFLSGASHQGPVRKDELVRVADVLPEAVLVRRGLDAAAHDQAADGQVSDLRHDGDNPTLGHEGLDEALDGDQRFASNDATLGVDTEDVHQVDLEEMALHAQKDI